MKNKFLAGLLVGISILGSIAAVNRIEQLKLTSDADAGGFQISNLGSPTNSSNAATLGYVTNQIAAASTNYASAAHTSATNNPHSVTASQAGAVPAILQTNAPATNAAGTPGSLIQNGNYLYLCTGTNTWRRIELLTW